MALTDKEFEKAKERGQLLRDKAFVVGARYTKRDGLVAKLHSGVELRVPILLIEGLRGAAVDDLKQIEVSPSGLGLHWPTLDVDLYVPALLEGVTGTKREMAAQLGAVGGRARSQAKVIAARANGLKGGRPKKQAAGAVTSRRGGSLG
ncbi:MAG: DUF2442 domain-containing protein [Alphaproteobacteria bacterium]|nr:DUF2442 domain-containing protein [Alphaproteobacteria bacterium]